MNTKMNCEECGQHISPIWEELDMSKNERIAYELGYNQRSSYDKWIVIIGWVLGFTLGLLIIGGIF